MSEWFFFATNDFNYSRSPASYSRRSGCSRKPGRGALYSAAERGKLARLSFLLALGQNPNRADTYGITPLQIAAWNNHCKIVQKLCKTKIDVNIADRVGHTALFKAVSRDCHDCIQILLRTGANCDHQDDSGNTALMLSADFGFKDSLVLLLASGANVNKQNRWGETALYISVLQGNSECVQPLLDFGANPNLSNFEGCTPLYVFAQQSLTVTNYCMLRSLLLSNPDLDIKGRDMDSNSSAKMTPLKAALLCENYLVADILVTLGADTNFLLTETIASLKNRLYWKRHFAKISSTPRLLTDLCRCTIRSCVRANSKSLNDIILCGLPLALVKFVTMSDLPASRGAYIQSRASALDLKFIPVHMQPSSLLI